MLKRDRDRIIKALAKVNRSGGYRYTVSTIAKDTGVVNLLDFHDRESADRAARTFLYVNETGSTATVTDHYSHKDKLRWTCYRYDPQMGGIIIDADYTG